MADHPQYSIDISALWGPDGEGGLVPAREFLTNQDDFTADPAVSNGNGNGNGQLHTTDLQTHDDVGGPSEAIAGSNGDLLRSADLQAMRADLEKTFTQQLSAALYELLGACAFRFASAEEHINERLTAAVEAQTRQLTASLEANFYVAVEVSESVRAQLDAVRKELAEPVEECASFQRELSQKIGRLGDVVDRQSVELSALRQQLAELQAGQGARRGLAVQDV